MGVPVSPRNIFPSNIQGLPTWYEVRVNERGWLGRRGGVDLMVAMNPQTWDRDVAEIEPGGYLMYDSSKPLPASRFRDDIHVLGVPLTDLCATRYPDPRERQLLKNIVYVGVLAALLGVEPEVIATLIGEQYQGKAKLIQPNLDAFMMGLHHGREYFDDALGLRIERRDAVGRRIFVEGNAAAALGCVYGGATVCAWYPITPSSSLAEGFQKYCAKLRVDKASGKHKYAIVQAEDEIASIGIVVGAGWNGARAFTATSGPGVSLMTEFIGLAYFAEIPVTIIDVQRGGPSTGMPTRTQQADVLACAYASHGDTKHVLLFPEDPHECFDFAARCLDLADRLQTPVFLMTDLDIGMNHRLCEPFTWDDARRYDRGKVMSHDELEAGREFGRYLDVDGDGIPYRTYPGHAPDQRRVLHPRHDARRLCTLFRGRPRLPLQRAAAVEEVRDREGAGAAAYRARGGARDPLRCDLLRLDQPGDGRSARRVAGPRHPRRHLAHSRVPVQRRGRPLPCRARDGVRRRAEPRRAAAHAAGQRTAGRPGAAAAGAALRRHADHRALHHRGDRRTGALGKRRADPQGEGRMRVRGMKRSPRSLRSLPPEGARQYLRDGRAVLT